MSWKNDVDMTCICLIWHFLLLGRWNSRSLSGRDTLNSVENTYDNNIDIETYGAGGMIAGIFVSDHPVFIVGRVVDTAWSVGDVV